jgi:hypothetical protein
MLLFEHRLRVMCSHRVLNRIRTQLCHYTTFSNLAWYIFLLLLIVLFTLSCFASCCVRHYYVNRSYCYKSINTTTHISSHHIIIFIIILFNLQMGLYLVAVILQQDNTQITHITQNNITRKQNTAHKTTQTIKDTLHKINIMQTRFTTTKNNYNYN